MLFRFTWSLSLRKIRTMPRQCCYVGLTTFKTPHWCRLTLFNDQDPTTHVVGNRCRPVVADSGLQRLIRYTTGALSSSIGGLVVKLAVAIRDLISYNSASPGFDSRPMQECTKRHSGDCSFALCSVPSRGSCVRGWEPSRVLVFAVGIQWD